MLHSKLCPEIILIVITIVVLTQTKATEFRLLGLTGDTCNEFFMIDKEDERKHTKNTTKELLDPQ